MEPFKPSLKHIIYEFICGPGYLPLKRHELAKALNLHSDDRREVRMVLRELEDEGKILCLRKNRWALPDTGNLDTGVLQVHRNGFGFFMSEKPGRDDVFVPKSSVNGALNGDRVQVSVIKLPARRGKPGTKKPDQTARHEARVVRVLERKSDIITGMLRMTEYYRYVIPDNPRVHELVRIRDSESNEFASIKEFDKVAVRLDPWDRAVAPLSGEIMEHLGPADDPDVEILCLVKSHGLTAEFSPRAEEEAQQFSEAPDEAEIQNRVDYRNVMTLTIDPEDARDFDDAISLNRLPGGDWELGVHIADVSFYVTPDSAMDREARERSTSAYLADRVITMLPRRLTSDVCSLQPNKDRLTHTVFMRLNEQGEIQEVKTHKSVIHSRIRLNYVQVQAYLDGAKEKLPAEACPLLDDVRELARALRRKRMRAGSLAFNLPEVKCILDDAGKVVRIEKRTCAEAYQLIEECMLAANQSVARILADQDVPGIYRIHKEPDDKRWEELADSLGKVGINAEPKSQRELNQVSKNAEGSPMGYMVDLMILRHMNRAIYSPHRQDHFGLAFTHYTHFTSPIRRYPDLMVHRILHAIEQGAPPPYDAEGLNTLASQCTMNEKTAEDVERESIDIKRVAYFRDQLQDGAVGPFSGLIVDIKPKGLIVELAETLQKGMVPFAYMMDDHYTFDRSRGRAVGRRGKTCWSLGQRMEVELVRVDIQRRFVDFKLAGKSARKKGKKRKT